MSGDGVSDVVVLREQGNGMFKAGDFDGALRAYLKALELEPTNHVLYSNCSAAHLKLGNAKQALEDADACLALKPDMAKGHYRRGQALEANDMPEMALAAYQAALDLDPNSRDLISKFQVLKRSIKQSKQAERERLQRQKAQAAEMARMEEHMRAMHMAGNPDAADDAQDNGGGASGVPSNDAWARGLGVAQRSEWFVDCYRMRVDDDAAWGGGNLHGLYDMDATKASICLDFLKFCKLAVVHKVVPDAWDWAHCLRTAATLLPYAFEKEDAKEKWGGENVFAAMMGGRSLRFTGEVVYGTSVMNSIYAEQPESSLRVEEELQPWEGSWQQLVTVQAGAVVFEGVGGQAPWRRLHDSMHAIAGRW